MGRTKDRILSIILAAGIAAGFGLPSVTNCASTPKEMIKDVEFGSMDQNHFRFKLTPITIKGKPYYVCKFKPGPEDPVFNPKTWLSPMQYDRLINPEKWIKKIDLEKYKGLISEEDIKILSDKKSFPNPKKTLEDFFEPFFFVPADKIHNIEIDYSKRKIEFDFDYRVNAKNIFIPMMELNSKGIIKRKMKFYSSKKKRMCAELEKDKNNNDNHLRDITEKQLKYKINTIKILDREYYFPKLFPEDKDPNKGDFYLMRQEESKTCINPEDNYSIDLKNPVTFFHILVTYEWLLKQYDKKQEKIGYKDKKGINEEGLEAITE